MFASLDDVDEPEPLTRAEESHLAVLIQNGRWAERRLSLPTLRAHERRSLERMVEQARRAHNALVRANVRLIHGFVARWTALARKRGLDYDDVYQSGVIGMCEAAWRFDPLRWKVRFGTYAVHWVNNAVRRAVRSASTVAVPHYDEYDGVVAEAIARATSDAEAAAQVAAHIHARGTPRARRIAKRFTPALIASIRIAVQANAPLSLDAALDSDPDSRTLADCIAAPGGDVEQTVLECDERRRFYRAIADLPQREREVIELVLADCSFSDIARRFGVSRRIVGGWYRSAIRRLQVCMDVTSA